MAQGSFGELEIFDDFLGPDQDLTWGTGGVKVGNFGFTSVNEGSFEWTVDEPGGIVAITTDTGDDDNACLYAGTFNAADGGVQTEWRFKVSAVTATTTAIFCGLTETLDKATPVMPAEFAAVTTTYNGTGGMAGILMDTDGAAIDFRAVAGDAGAGFILTEPDGTVGTAALGVRCNVTVTADKWYLVRVEMDPDGKGRIYFGDASTSKELKEVAKWTNALGTADQMHACLMIENRDGNARVLEVDYGWAHSNRDWAP